MIPSLSLDLSPFTVVEVALGSSVFSYICRIALNFTQVCLYFRNIFYWNLFRELFLQKLRYSHLQGYQLHICWFSMTCPPYTSSSSLSLSCLCPFSLIPSVRWRDSFQHLSVHFSLFPFHICPVLRYVTTISTLNRYYPALPTIS